MPERHSVVLRKVYKIREEGRMITLAQRGSTSEADPQNSLLRGPVAT